MRQDARAMALERSVAGSARVFTDPKASPTGFPFKVLEDDASLINPQVYETRERICDLGGLRDAYRKPDGTIGFRCAGEPVEDYLAKGGKFEDTVGRMCLCNCLLSAAGFAQVRKGVEEPYVITAGDDVANIARYLKPGRSSYCADDVIDVLMSDV
jgi:NAD(P)H-dependent flavin oxidoreductase YrpB (nitropropane dioxygenase family)